MLHGLCWGVYEGTDEILIYISQFFKARVETGHHQNLTSKKWITILGGLVSVGIGIACRYTSSVADFKSFFGFGNAASVS